MSLNPRGEHAKERSQLCLAYPSLVLQGGGTLRSLILILPLTSRPWCLSQEMTTFLLSSMYEPAKPDSDIFPDQSE